MCRSRLCAPISIHALREEGDSQSTCKEAPTWQFLSTPSARRATALRSLRQTRKADFYPRPPRGGRPHALLCLHAAGEFLSTPSARRATQLWGRRTRPLRDFYPRPPRGGRRSSKEDSHHDSVISIHALREEGDHQARRQLEQPQHFYPRPPRGGRPRHGHYTSDKLVNFYPRPPRGGRQDSASKLNEAMKFLSTPSARRATVPPRASFSSSFYFYPRPPRGGRQQKQRQNLYFQTNYTTFCTNLEEP